MSTLGPFHRNRGSWFECPHCGHRSYTCLVGAKYSLAPRSFSVLFKCEGCNHYAKLRHPFLPYLSFLVSLLVVFPLTYHAVLHFSGNWPVQVAVLLGVVALVIISHPFVSRLVNRYVPVTDDNVL